ncbi:MAG: NAD(P)-dependent oxidoreductase [Candidatus Marinimicrobia bacterium]|nr:NAD(P)-dependent oxidoreductase [Candidatus Neomarinimicrobiota bacterium]
MKIGFIGMGIMGSRMAKNLVKNGFDVSVHNRTYEKAKPVIESGAKWVNDIVILAKNSDIIITMLSTPEVVNEIACGERGFLTHMKKDSIWIDSTTVDPEFSIKMSKKAEKYGINFLDAPVSGSLIPAERGELIFLVGGKKEIFEKCIPLFNAMGKKYIHVGENGKGSALKLAANLLLGVTYMGFVEALIHAESHGIPKKLILDFLLNSHLTAPFLSAKRSKIEHEEFSPEFPLEWLRKDLFLCLATGYRNNVPMPATSVAESIYALAKNYGLSRDDFTAVYKFLKKIKI